VAERTAESYDVLDVAGMNYMEARYELDREFFPRRVIVGSETFADRIDRLWRLVRDNPHVIGDFTWTGWDYLGEAGIGRTSDTEEPGAHGFAGPFPIGVSFIGGRYREAALLPLAFAFEQGTRERRPPTFIPTIGG